MPPASPRRPSSKLTTLWGRQLLPDHFHTTIHHVQPATDYNRSISLPPSSPMTSRRSSVASNSEFLPRCSTLPSRNVYTVPSSTLRRASVDNFSAAGLARDRRSISQDVERPRRGSMISQVRFYFYFQMQCREEFKMRITSGGNIYYIQSCVACSLDIL